jgi:hypothetical protein
MIKNLDLVIVDGGRTRSPEKTLTRSNAAFLAAINAEGNHLS